MCSSPRRASTGSSHGSSRRSSTRPRTLSRYPRPACRFNDIDNVGKTGSHFTMFEMMAHHVFNKKGKEIYWKDRTTELCHEFLTKVQGLDPKAVNYSEAWWEGGGNAGPCLEVLLGGVEVATLVFMSYSTANGQQKPLDMQVVDTGYGLERLTWMSQGTPSAYEAVFGDVLNELKKLSGTKVDESSLAEYSKVAGSMKIETAADVRALRADTAARLGMNADDFMRQIKPFESMYVVCDHTRALMFMLSDGVVPSNVRQGYFARLLVRRALREMSQLGIERKLSEIVSMQIDYFAKDFPDVKENRDEILKLVDVEQEKYKDTLVKGRSIVKRLESSRAQDHKKISDEDLIELYDSHGLNPEVVAEFASGPVSVPDDFYQRVAARHSKSKEEAGGRAGRTAARRPPCDQAAVLQGVLQVQVQGEGARCQGRPGRPRQDLLLRRERRPGERLRHDEGHEGRARGQDRQHRRPQGRRGDAGQGGQADNLHDRRGPEEEAPEAPHGDARHQRRGQEGPGEPHLADGRPQGGGRRAPGHHALRGPHAGRAGEDRAPGERGPYWRG